MNSQEHSLDLSALAHALPASPSPAEEDKVVASLPTLPPELKLAIFEEIYQDPRTMEDMAAGCEFGDWGRLQRRETRMKELSLVDKQFYELSAILRWREVDLFRGFLFSLHFFVFNIFRTHRSSIRILHINRHSAQNALPIRPAAASPASVQLPLFHLRREMTWTERNLMFDQAEKLEKRMTGSTTRYNNNCKDRDEFRWDIEGVLFSFILRSCTALHELEVDGSGLLQRTFIPPPLPSLRSLTLNLSLDNNLAHLAFVHQSPHLEQLSIGWAGGGHGAEPPFRNIVNNLNHLSTLKSLELYNFPPTFFAGPPVINLQLETLCLHSPAYRPPVPLSFLQLFAPTLRHLHLGRYSEPTGPPSNEPLLPHLVSLDPPHLWRALGFVGPAGGDKKA